MWWGGLLVLWVRAGEVVGVGGCGGGVWLVVVVVVVVVGVAVRGGVLVVVVVVVSIEEVGVEAVAAEVAQVSGAVPRDLDGD